MRKRAVFSIILVLSVLLSGTAGYILIEGWSFLDSLYMTVITLSTVGYQEVSPLSEAGRAFTAILIIMGIGVVFYVINNAMVSVFEGEFQKLLGRKKLEKMIKSMKDHFIICGHGRMGKIICRELMAKKVPYVVIEKEADEPGSAVDTAFIQGDATNDDLLKEAGIKNARGLISVLSTDAQNLYVVLSARELNPALFIVARAGEEGSEQKLMRAGANRVVSPYHTGGLRIAHTAIKPAVVDFLEFATRSGNLELQMEEIPLRKSSSFTDKTIHDTGIGRELGVIIVAIKRPDGEMTFNPLHKSTLRAGDTLIAIGESEKLAKLEELASGKG